MACFVEGAKEDVVEEVVDGVRCVWIGRDHLFLL
jgi:hypothetical protein